MSGEFTGKTFDADGLVQTASTFKGRRPRMVDVNHKAVRPLLAGTAAVAPVKSD